MPAATKRNLRGAAAPAPRPSPGAEPAAPAGRWKYRSVSRPRDALVSPLSDDKVLLGHTDLLALGITYTRQHLYRLMRRSAFPQTVALGSPPYARKVWRRADIMNWLHERGLT
jgi:predicted DNA-binding transcriptional regulator AlpA